ncbi:TPA: hypothetical protein N0F65_003759 [Lagenidium giganteum]|uniref:Transmembrane protein n=1 Tax=Lagenidium giganteum TaxID=4803 RepID=A0AAV2YKK0_9STRA|nr:TPA: hypothetical protein N0F65_003759 [Lagenidium giganteum]
MSSTRSGGRTRGNDSARRTTAAMSSSALSTQELLSSSRSVTSSQSSMSTTSTSRASLSTFQGRLAPLKTERRHDAPLLHTVSSMSSVASSLDDPMDEGQYYELHLFAYRLIYVIQGAFMGLLGPSLGHFSMMALKTAGLNSPVASFGPIFAAHGGAALVMSFMSEIVLNVAIEKDLMKYLMIVVLLCSGVWYACLPAVAAASGSLGVSIYFIAKGVWTALLNISLNRCCLWVAGEKVEKGRRLITYMNVAFGLGTVLGPTIALVLDELSVDLCYAFYALGIATIIPVGILLMLASPRPMHLRDEHQTLLRYEDPTRRVPTVPSPIVGGVFLHAKHYGGSANLNPDHYDAMNNLIILFVTIFSTILFGIQLGLGAFLFDYVGHVLTVSPHPLPNEGVFTWGCLMMILFWASIWLSYLFFSKFMFHAFNLFSIFHLSIVCMVSSFGILFGAETGFATFTLCLLLFGFALAPLFTLSIHCLTRVINEQLIRRVSSLIVFGCGMGEVFIPVLMGFFMGDYSGKMYGSVAVSYITFILSICLVGASGMLLMMVKKKLSELESDDKHALHGIEAGSAGSNVAGLTVVGAASKRTSNKMGGY